MAIPLVRARCTTTGAIAALSAKALELGHITNWVRADGPTPKRSKSAVLKKSADTASASEVEE